MSRPPAASPPSRLSPLALAATALLLLGCAGAAASAADVATIGPDDGFVVVISEKNPVSTISRAELGLMFLMCEPLWPKGMKVRPVDLPGDSPTRKEFSLKVLGKDARAVMAHWQRLLFSGDGVPPRVVPSQREALEFVASNPGGICYASVDAALPAGVKTVRVVD
jgi:hypothetical protein